MKGVHSWSDGELYEFQCIYRENGLMVWFLGKANHPAVQKEAYL
jgi:hypothetical protein